jgi:ribonuclease E
MVGTAPFDMVRTRKERRLSRNRRHSAMDHNKANKMLIDASHPEETRVVVLRNGRVEEFDFESASKKPLRGNIYLAKVTRVEPSLQACFVEYGGNRHGFLAFAEIHPDYYQIPMADRQALLDEEMAAELEAEQEADERAERLASRRNRDQAGNSAQPYEAQPHAQPDHATAQDGEQWQPLADGETSPHTQDAHPEDHPQADAAFDEPRSRTEAVSTGLQDQELHASALDPEAAAGGLGGDHDPNSGQQSDAHGDHDHDHHHDHDHGEGQGHVEDVPSQADEQPETIAGSGDQPSLGTDASEDMPERPRRPRRRPYKIQEVIKRRQVMLIQVVKEERGTKGAALTTYLSLAGRYTVLMPNTGRGGGISRKITQPQDRKRLKAIAQELEVPDGMGLIIRTAGAARSMQEVRRDYEYLMRLWESVRDLTLSSTAPSLVYEEGSLIKRAIRDLYTKEIDEIVVSGKEAHREAQDFMRMLMPSHVRNVIQHDRPEPLFARYPAADRQLSAMFSPTVPLKSGGYLVINQTEALVAIDINSGKSTREFNIEDTALNTNLEAADEIARQLKLRDLAGLIVIDFIDMEEKRNNRAVERRIKEALRFDRARLQVGRISHFGLLEMSRQRMRQGVLEGSTTKCPHCEGTGIVRSVESISLAVLRGLEEFLGRDNRSSVNVLTQADVALYILNHKRSYVMDLERRYGIAIALLASDKMQGANFAVERSAAVLRREPERAAVNMNMGFDGSEPPIEEMEEAPSLQPYGEPEEIADDGEIDDPRSQRTESNGQERREPREGRDNRENRETGEDGRDRGRGRRRRRGRGRGRDERGYDRDQPRAATSVDEAGLVPDQQPMADFDSGLGDELNEASPAAAQPLNAGDDAPELSNGDGEDGVARAEGGATEDAAEGDRRGKRRRRGRRGGRRTGSEGEVNAETAGDSGGNDAVASDGAEDAAATAGSSSVNEAPTDIETQASQPVAEAIVSVAPAAQPEELIAAKPSEPPVAEPEETVPAPSSRRASAPVSSEPEIVSDAPARPARKGWWKPRMLGQ